ncbi:MAG: hypothetical protein ACRENB_01290 [Gemmatimonadales bacterium]
MRRPLVRRLISLLLFATAVAMGPGLALVEARAHAGLERSGHGRRDHFEARGGQDHDDRCASGIASSPANPSPVARGGIRSPLPAVICPAPTGPLLLSSLTKTLPPSRGPPAIA